MEKAAGRILKAEAVKLQGHSRCDVGGASPQQSVSADKPVSAAPQVRIVENTAEYAIVEMTCRCGVKTQVRCEYGQPKPK